MSMDHETPFTRLANCRLPIQVAPMGGAMNTTRLARAVCAAGGHAMQPVVMVPQPRLEQIIGELASETQAFGVNFIAPIAERASLELAAERAPMVELYLGDPDGSLVELVHAGGALASWQVGSVEEARRAADAGCDVIVAKGTEAGGRSRGEVALLPLLEGVLEAVEVPVLAAGAIAGPRAVAAVMAAGASGVRVGTRLLATIESDAHAQYKRAVIDAGAEDAVLACRYVQGAPPGIEMGPERVLRSAIESADRLEGDVVGEAHVDGEVRPIPRFGVNPPGTNVTGAVEAMALFAGQGVGAVHEVEPAAAVIESLAAGLPRVALDVA